jgi:hypothetical protein
MSPTHAVIVLAPRHPTNIDTKLRLSDVQREFMATESTLRDLAAKLTEIKAVLRIDPFEAVGYTNHLREIVDGLITLASLQERIKNLEARLAQKTAP